MARSYKFSIVQARPDSMRGERVNVGVVAIGPNGLDIRLPEVRKLRHLTGHHWESIADAFARALAKSSHGAFDLTTLGEKSQVRSEVFLLGKPGDLVADTPEEYESAVKKILDFFVNKPSLSRKERQQKINGEISAMLRSVGVLAQRGETIDDGKVITKFIVSEEKEIIADFAYKPNGLKIVSTLDLRGMISAAHSKACEKGAILYFARETFGSSVRPIGVYAATPAETTSHSSEIEILRSFAEGNAYNWMDPQDRQNFRHALY